MTDISPTRPVVVVGVHSGQPDDVVLHAIRFAEIFGAELVCATVAEAHPGSNASKRAQGEQDRDAVDSIGEVEPEFADHLLRLLNRSSVPRSLHRLSGDPAEELDRLAEELSAKVIIVGTRRPSLRASAHEFFAGSVAVHLAHRQHRPVIIIPLTPVPHGTKLPWEEA